MRKWPSPPPQYFRSRFTWLSFGQFSVLIFCFPVILDTAWWVGRGDQKFLVFRRRRRGHAIFTDNAAVMPRDCHRRFSIPPRRIANTTTTAATTVYRYNDLHVFFPFPLAYKVSQNKTSVFADTIYREYHYGRMNGTRPNF